MDVDPYDVFLDHVTNIMQKAGFTVTAGGEVGGKVFSAVAEGDGFGKTRRFAVDLNFSSGDLSSSDLKPILDLISSRYMEETEYWVVANGFSNSAREEAHLYRALRLLTFHELRFVGELEEVLGNPLPETRRASKLRTNAGQVSRPRTNAGKAILANQTQIAVTCAALLVLIDERLVALTEERPNSDQASKVRDDAIAQYEKLKQDVQALAQATSDFKSGTGSEKEAVRASKSFGEGVQNWWTKGHEKIVQSAWDMGLFGVAIVICSSVGAGGKVAAAVSAAIVGGKQLGTALKGMKGLWQS